MSGDWINAALEDLESRKAKIESLIAGIRELQEHDCLSAQQNNVRKTVGVTLAYPPYVNVTVPPTRDEGER